MELLGKKYPKSLDETYDEARKLIKDFYLEKGYEFLQICSIIADEWYKGIKEDFFNLSKETLFSFDKNKTEYVRALYGAYDNVDPNKLEKIINGTDGYKKMDSTTYIKYIKDFRVEFLRDLRLKIELYIMKSEGPSNASIEVLRPFLGENYYSSLQKKGFLVIGDIIKLTRYDFKNKWGKTAKTGDEVIKLIDNLGLRFVGDEHIQVSSFNDIPGSHIKK